MPATSAIHGDTCYHGGEAMPRAQNSSIEKPTLLAQDLVQTLLRERVIPRFVDSYVVANNRHALQVHAGLYRDLLTILQREALLAACVRALEIASTETVTTKKGKQLVIARKGAELFRRKFLTALARQLNWNAGDALDFQSDLRMYEDLLARAASSRRPRKPYEAANHPFVDRSAFLLDSAFLEKARLAASRALAELEEVATKVTHDALGNK